MGYFDNLLPIIDDNINVINCYNKKTLKVDYTTENLTEYLTRKKNEGINLRCVTWSEFNTLEAQKLITPFKRVKRSDFYELFECLPPKHPNYDIKNFFIFICPENYSSHYTTIGLLDQINGRYYFCRDSEFITKKELLNKIKGFKNA